MRSFAFLIHPARAVFFLLFLGKEAKAQALFESLPSSKTGVNFKNKIIEDARQNALTYQNLYNGGGTAAGDINNDGLEDIYFVSNTQQNRLYLNQGNFKFIDITAKAGVGGRPGWKSGTAMVDINGDGLLDIYVCYSGKTQPEMRKNQFFINQGNLTFLDKAREMGLDDDSYTTQCAFFDYDLDGDLDVFLLATNVKVIHDLEYAKARKNKHPYAGDKLFKNNHGKFIEVTEQAGILSNELGFGLGVSVSDVNKDGWPDIYVSNDYDEPDYLYINNKNGAFSNQLESAVAHISYFSMGNDIADINNDGWPDIFTADMLPEDNVRQKLLYGPDNWEHFSLMVSEGYYYQFMRNMLQLNNGDGTFSEVGQLAGVSNTDWSWAPLMADFDNDGWKDLFVSNGYFRDYTNRDFLKFKGDYYFQKALEHKKIDTLELARSMPSTPIHNYMFRNTGSIRFEDMSLAWGFDKPSFSTGAAFSDLDNDGDLDLIVSNQNAEAWVYKNRARENNPERHYLNLQLKGEGLNSRGIGSKVSLFAQGRVQYLEQMPVRGYQSSVSDRLHFGLGAVSSVDSLAVIWPSGRKSTLFNVKVDQLLTSHEKDAAPPSPALTKRAEKIFTEINSIIPYRYVEYGANDFKRQPLLNTMLSPCGPVMAVADINADGLTDVFVGGTKESPGQLFVQSSPLNFKMRADFKFKEDIPRSDSDAIFFDADNDSDLDLYAVSGGYHEYQKDDDALQDRLYINDGKGNFTKSAQALPRMSSAKSCVRPCDFDQDGDLDLFAGGRVVPGFYPLPPPSYLLLNDGSGHFSDATAQLLPALSEAGMVTDAAWIDLNHDKYPDLITAGEFMPLRVFINKNGKRWEEQTRRFFKNQQNGLWSRLALADFDHDGDDDLIAGNFGLNSQFKASPDEPMTLYYNDFDKNGSVDPVLVSYVQHKPCPFAGRDELLDQLYSLRQKFTSYAQYAKASLADLFSAREINEASKLSVAELQTTYFENKGDYFEKRLLPTEAQYAPVYAIQVLDYNGDGHLDFILAGNQSAIRIRLGSIDANYGQLYAGDGKGNFVYVPQTLSGLSFAGDVKSLKIIRAEGKEYLLAGINNYGLVTYQLKKK